jgi:hypothetical protein
MPPPSQAKLPFAAPSSSKVVTQAKSKDFVEANHEAARIILSDRARYAGIMVEWARLVLGLED